MLDDPENAMCMFHLDST